jgi:hypothetical protein
MHAIAKFEDLPANIQALLLAKLGMEVSARRCKTIHELAIRQRTDLMSVWKAVCRAAGQPPCAIPVGVANEHRRNVIDN